MNKKTLILTGYLLLFALVNVNADIITELAKRDRNNTIRFDWPLDPFSLYTEGGYLITGVFSDGPDETSIGTYKND